MNNKFILLPIIFIRFWYFEAPLEIVGYFGSFNDYFMKLFSLPLSLKTYFQPLKNEYREGLVGFSRAMGMLLKTGIIITDLLIFIVILVCEAVVVLSFLIFPIAAALLLFF